MVLDLPGDEGELPIKKQIDVRETPVQTTAPITASYVVIGANTDLTDERVLTAGEGIDFTDGGANSTLTIDGENATLTNKGIVELATIAETQTGTSEALAVCPNSLFEVLVPIGAIIAWAKSMTGVPATLPTSFVECDGSVINDAASPMNGQTLPDLNGGEFLRGNSTSGATGGSETMAHTHTGTASGTTGNSTDSFSGTTGSHTLTIAEIPSHRHLLDRQVPSTYSSGGLPSGSGYFIFSALAGTYTDYQGGGVGHTHSFSGTTSGHTHSFSDGFTTSAASNTENRPPFYDVVWIMRIK